jgi:DNA-binding Xre family transcriptional regulator
MDIWERRRKNLKALIAYKDTNPARVAEQAGLSVNSIGKFIRGDTHTMKQETLDKICQVLDISNPAILDSANPLSAAKDALYARIAEMSDSEAEHALSLLNSKSD